MAACTKSDFTTWPKVYESPTGASGFLNDYGNATGKKWRLTIDRKNPTSAVAYGAIGGQRTYTQVINGWKAGYEIDWPFCDKDKQYYKVTWPAKLEELERAIVGKVTDKLLGTPIVFAKVSFEGKSAVTDKNGEYKITDPAAFSGTIKASMTGYNSSSKGITSPMTGKLVVDFELTQIPTPTPPTPPPSIYKILPEPPATIHGEGIALYKKLDQALFDKNSAEIIKLLKEAILIPQSPMPLLIIIFGIAGVVGTIATILGSYPFAGFLREEAIQTLDIGIMTATKNKDVAELEHLIKTKEEILERTLWEKILGTIPIVNVVASLWDYFAATRAKLQTDKNVLAAMRLSTGATKLPEKLKANVRDIIDGDTIDVALTATDEATGNEVTLPQEGTTGHARIRILGINAPEKSPKGEIVCTGQDVLKVALKYADLSRQALLYLNDKNVTLKIDSAHQVDVHGRILAVVEYAGQDIGLEQIKEGLACHYFVEENKQVDDAAYSAAAQKAKEENIGMWAEILLPVPGAAPGEVPGEVAAPVGITFSIDSKPTGAKVFIDEIYTRHLTPTNEAEQKDVIVLWKEGTHKLRLVKGGYSYEGQIELTPGVPLIIDWVLEGMVTPPPEVVPPEVIPPEVTPPTVIIPQTLQEFFDIVKTYYVGRLYLSKKELAKIESDFKIGISGVTPLVSDEILKFYAEMKMFYVGRLYLSKKELATLGEKYQLSITGLV